MHVHPDSRVASFRESIQVHNQTLEVLRRVLTSMHRHPKPETLDSRPRNPKTYGRRGSGEGTLGSDVSRDHAGIVRE